MRWTLKMLVVQRIHSLEKIWQRTSKKVFPKSEESVETSVVSKVFSYFLEGYKNWKQYFLVFTKSKWRSQKNLKVLKKLVNLQKSFKFRWIILLLLGGVPCSPVPTPTPVLMSQESFKHPINIWSIKIQKELSAQIQVSRKTVWSVCSIICRDALYW